MKRIILTITLTITLTLTVAAQAGRQLKVYMKGGLVDKVQVDGDASIGHSRTDLNGTVHDDYVSAVFKDAEGRERQYLISQLDSLVMPNGRRVVFIGNQNGYVNGNNDENQNENQNENENGSRSLKRSSFSGKFPGAGTGNVTFKWTENDRIRLDVGYESRAEQLSADGTSASFVFDEADDLQAERYWVYFPDRRVIIKSVQTQTGANNSLHIYDSGDCGTAIATRNGNDNGNENDNENENSEHPSSNTTNPSPTTYTFTLEHKAAYLCFLPHIDNLPSAKLTKITLSCSAAIAGTYLLSENGLYNASNTSSTITLNLVPQKSIDFFIGHDALTEQDSCAAYMVIAPQSSSQTFTATYYITDTLSHISKVYRQTFSLKPVANTVYPVTCHILDEEFRTIDLGLSCNWSNVNVGAREPSKTGSTFDSDAKANAALLEQTVVTQWLMPDEDQCEEILEKCRWTFGIYNAQTGYFVEGAAVAKEYGEKLRIFLPWTGNGTPTPSECLAQNYRPVEVLMVDLGLSSGTKWAARNIGATSVEDYGHYYAWGEVDVKESYTSNNYLYGTQNLGDNYDISGTQNDAVVINWGGLWRMPTKDQMTELVSEGDWLWSSINGVNGFVITGPNGNKIFLPASGLMEGSSAIYTGNGGTYYSSTLAGDRTNEVWTLYWQYDRSHSVVVSYASDDYYKFNSSERPVRRYYGRTIRPVTIPTAVAADGNSYVIATDSAVWKLRDTKAKLYGTLSSSLPIKGTLTVGFVVGDSAQIIKETARLILSQQMSIGGVFKDSLDVYDNVGYWYRAYLEVDDTVYYGNARHYGYEYVDLALPSGTLWANMNVGSSQPSDYGYYYAWGEVAPKVSYTSANYKYGNQSLGVDYDIAGSDYDAAHVNMGGTWRMPTKAQMEELVSHCVWKWTTQDGINGYRITGTNGKSIFLPASGLMDGSDQIYTVNGGTYFTSTLEGDRSNNVWTLYWQKDRSASYVVKCSSDDYYKFNNNERPVCRYYGRTIRPVSMPTAVSEDGNMYTVLTDSTLWKLHDTKVKLYGSLNSSMPIDGALTVGFVVGDSAKIVKETARFVLSQQITASGIFKDSLDVHDNIGYWYRAYLEVGNATYYGEARHYGYNYVDLALASGTLWANMNVGACQPSDYGDYYAWGETVTKDSYTSGNYRYGTLNIGVDFDIAGTEYDAAHKVLGGAWRMPTKDQMEELVSQCDWTWTSQDGINGYRITGTNGNSIFLPASGLMDGSDRIYTVIGGTYFTSTLAGDRSNNVWTLYWQKDRSASYVVKSSSDDYYKFNNNERPVCRYYGRAIRPVLRPNAVTEDNMMSVFTDSASWKLNDEETILYGTLGSTLPLAEGTIAGFVVGGSSNVDKTSAIRILFHSRTTTGSFQETLDGIEDNIGYWYRAFLETPSGRVFYGEARHFGWEKVDLGLTSGTKWANMNVGASIPENYGSYYAWGEVEPKQTYSSGTYSTLANGIGILDISATSHDAAYVNMGSDWCMPTEDQMQELVDECDWVWTGINGINGYRVTGSNGNSIFLPSAGLMDGSSLIYDGIGATYHSSTLASVGSSSAWTLYWQHDRNSYYLIKSGSYDYYMFGNNERPVQRYYGRTVRAVVWQTAPRP